jgi:RNA polymerase sigma factor, sigma-70 family
MEKKMSLQEMTDEQLLEALRNGQEEITDYLMEKYKALVLKQAKTLYLIGGENDDLIQEGMIGLFKAVRDYREEKDTSFYHFARLCISRQMYHAIEASNRKKHAPLNGYLSIDFKEETTMMPEETIHTQNTDPEQIFIEQETMQNMCRKLMESLSKMERDVLTDYLEGMDYQAIAEKMGKTPKAIDNALQRIRRKVKDQLAARERCV